MDQEEHLAQLRYEKQQQLNNVMSLDGTTVQNSNSTWVHQASQESEPYMLSGYEEIMRREREREESVSGPRDAYSHLEPLLAVQATCLLQTPSISEPTTHDTNYSWLWLNNMARLNSRG